MTSTSVPHPNGQAEHPDQPVRVEHLDQRVKADFFSSSEWNALFADFTIWLQRINYAKGTQRTQCRHLKSLLTWLEAQGIEALDQVAQRDLENYRDHVHTLLHHRTGQGLSAATIVAKLTILRVLNKYLQAHGKDPILKIRLLTIQHLPTQRTILSSEQIKQLYQACSQDLQGMYDRCMLSLYYGCGLRYAEGANLLLDDIDLKNEWLRVRKGKYYLERYVPLSVSVSQDIQRFMEQARWYWDCGHTQYLLLNHLGKKVNDKMLNKRLQSLCLRAGIEVKMTLHGLRHSIATHLLQNGMHLEAVQRFLGHRHLKSTQTYTHIDPTNPG